MPEQIQAKLLGSLLKAGDICKDKCASIAGQFGERVQHAAENNHLHAGAFKVVLKMYRMELDKRDDFWRSLKLMVDMCEENGFFETHVGDLADEAEAADDPDAEAAESNVTQLNAGIHQLDEEDTGSTKRHGRKSKRDEAESPIEAAE